MKLGNWLLVIGYWGGECLVRSEEKALSIERSALRDFCRKSQIASLKKKVWDECAVCSVQCAEAVGSPLATSQNKRCKATPTEIFHFSLFTFHLNSKGVHHA